MDLTPRSPHDDNGFADGQAGTGGGGSHTLPPESEPNFFDRVGNLFTSPRRAFRSPRRLSFWLIPLLVILVVNVVHGLLLQDLYSEWFLEFAETNTAFSEEQRAAMIEAFEAKADAGTSVTTILQSVGGGIGSLGFAFFLVGLFYMLGVNFGLAGSARYLDIVGVLGLSSMAVVLREIITIPLKLSQQTLAIYTGPAAFAPHDGGMLSTVLGFFDIFDIARLVFITIGLSVVGKISTSRTAILVVAFWILGCGFKLIWAMTPFAGMTP
ncbi:MAG: YIP1 family protein [Candidatus Eisenbacteria bacterium]|uniref:YIP1 family protein n=1 Tax=Eiseniibacteriota bacterium TaxID=2212470 RepID=A0A956SE75_UNCEI|nr:YIP1 family protein [Candidatus Eisenbacteria bacterium]MCB9462748.1 YIP1 family protein [Candidatus Eisenbacteria bacterium]